MSARIVAGRQRTPYARVGDAFAILCTVASLGALVVAWRRDTCDHGRAAVKGKTSLIDVITALVAGSVAA